MKNLAIKKKFAAAVLAGVICLTGAAPCQINAAQTADSGESRTAEEDQAQTFSMESVNFRLNPSVKGIKVSWTAAGDCKNYRIYRRAEGGKWKKLADTDQEYYLDTKAAHGKTYSYSISPLDEDGKVVVSHDDTGLSLTFVNAPVLKSVTGNEKSITVKWSKVAAIDSYVVYRYGGSDSDWTKVGETKKRTFTDKTAETGVEYQYTVRAKLGEALSGFYSGKSAAAGLEEDDGEAEGSNGSYIFPIKASYKITSSFGARTCPYHGTEYHNGIDISCAAGTPIYAVAAGKVTTATYSSSWGNYIVISHGNGVTTQYAHCSKLAVGVGDTVSQGEVIGYVGKTGYATGYHLDFRFFINGTAKNPLNYLTR